MSLGDVFSVTTLLSIVCFGFGLLEHEIIVKARIKKEDLSINFLHNELVKLMAHKLFNRRILVLKLKLNNIPQTLCTHQFQLRMCVLFYIPFKFVFNRVRMYIFNGGTVYLFNFKIDFPLISFL